MKNKRAQAGKTAKKNGKSGKRRRLQGWRLLWLSQIIDTLSCVLQSP
ncbi:hypothetical protein QB898_08485 [Ottowia sp. 10c7w1]|uniref:Uncharacterized protein n=1 Tax=Ottowia cancrivicina TaxID=3040346 RepID=A0AAW6RLJ9_9BURK|nr:hypothetical protein [Ottowia sp. 10c7w1]